MVNWLSTWCLENSGWSCVWVGAYFWSSADCESLCFVVCSYSSFILWLYSMTLIHSTIGGYLGCSQVFLLGMIAVRHLWPCVVAHTCALFCCICTQEWACWILGVWMFHLSAYSKWFCRVMDQIILRSAGSIPITHVCHHLALQTF